MNTEIYDLGKIGITLGNEWDANINYEKLTFVFYKGDGYISVINNKNVKPTDNTKVWFKAVEHGFSSYEQMIASGKFIGTEEEYLQMLMDAVNASPIVKQEIVKLNAAINDANTIINVLNNKVTEVDITSNKANDALNKAENVVDKIETAEQAAINSSNSATAAQNSAAKAKTHLNIIQQQIDNMTTPEGVVIPENVVAQVGDNKAKLSGLKYKMLGFEPILYDKNTQESVTVKEDVTIPKGKYIVKGGADTIGVALRFYNDDVLVYTCNKYLTPSSVENVVLTENINEIRYYTPGGRTHFSIESSEDVSLSAEISSLKEYKENVSNAIVNNLLSKYGCSELYDSIKIDKKSVQYNEQTKEYELINADYWYVSQIDISNNTVVFLEVFLSNNPGVKAQAFFLDENDKVISTLFNRVGHSERELFTDFVLVPNGAKTLLIQSEEPNFRNVYKAEITNKKIPYYYFKNDYLTSRVNDIDKNKSGSDDTVTFAFLTDIHLPSNAGNSPKLLNYIANKTDINFAVCGGDIPDSNISGLEYLESVGKEWNTLLKKDCPNIRVLPCRGNHDYLGNLPNSTGHLTDAQTYNLVMSNNTDNYVEGEPSKMYYYFDIPKKNLRVIVLDWYDKGYSYMYMSKEEWDWLANVLKTDYRMLLFAHEGSAEGSYVSGENTWCHQTLQSILKAAKNKTSITYEYWVGSQSYQQTYNFENAGDIIACFSGHMHRDMNFNDEGLHTIVTTCDALHDYDRPNRVRGSINEQAFDVFTVNFKNDTIKSVRIGAGSDRTFEIG